VTDFPGLLRALAEREVAFLVIGGFAATAHGSSRLTADLDILYDRSLENLVRLIEAVAPLDPYLRGAPPGLPFRFDLPTLQAGLNFTLVTRLGALDLLGEVAGGGSYVALLPQSVVVPVFGLSIRCLSLEQLIATKRAAGRTRDLDALAELEIIREEQGRGQ
jgi:predicted nucleotidyltransferase